MGRLENGKWRRDDDVGRDGDGGRWHRPESSLREWVRRDDSGVFRPEAGRYDLYVSYACPWAHRTILVRALKGLEDCIGLVVMDPALTDQGWRIVGRSDGAGLGTTSRYLWELYVATDTAFTGRVTVPVLWDRNTQRIVNNESADIVQMLAREFDEFARNADLDLRPEALEDQIRELNQTLYENVNDGVYRCGFARTQDAYRDAFDRLFATLESLDLRLDRRRYLLGERVTEPDVRLFTTMIRFDAVYHGHFKCNDRRLSDFPSLFGWVRDLYQMPGVRETVDFEHIKRHYYTSHPHLNPSRIVPAGPNLSYLDWPHARAEIPSLDGAEPSKPRTVT